MQQRRKFDSRRGRRLGVLAHVVSWSRPARPDWMDEATYAEIPGGLAVRELGVTVDQAGFRVNELVLVTTLLDAGGCTKQDISELFVERWNIEVCQAEYVSSDTLYRCPEPSHSGRLGVIGAGPMVSSTPRARPGTTVMRRHIERHLPPRLGIIRDARSA